MLFCFRLRGGWKREILNCFRRQCRSVEHFRIRSVLSEEPNYLYPQAIYSLSGKCFTTQGVMQHRVIFPSKPNGLTVLLHAPKDIADKMDPEVANW